MLNTNHRQDQGQSFVELAISFSFLLLLFIGVADLGRLLYSYIVVHDASQEGATYASIDPTNQNEILNRVKTYSNFPVNFSGFGIITQSDYDSSNTGINGVLITTSNGPCAGYNDISKTIQNQIEVRVRYGFKLLTPLFSGVEIPLRSSSKVTILTPQCP